MTITHIGAIAPVEQTVMLTPAHDLGDWQQLLMVRGICGNHCLWANEAFTRLVYVFVPTDGEYKAIIGWPFQQQEFKVWITTFVDDLDATVFGAMQWTLQQAAEQIEAERS